MGKLRRFLGFLAFVFVTAFSAAALAEGYSCPTDIEYTSCEPGYYMVSEYGGSTYDGTPATGNGCTLCPSGYTCSGGTAAPSATVTYKAGNTVLATITCYMGSNHTVLTPGQAAQTDEGVEWMEDHEFLEDYGWEFDGWTQSSDPSAVSQYEPGNSFSCNGNITLYPIWAREILLTYYASASATTSTQTSYTQEYRNTTSTTAGPTAITTPSLYTNSTYGWAPLGWADADGGNDAAIVKAQTGSTSTSFTPSPDNTVYYAAVYSRTPTVAYNANGGSGSTSSSNCAAQKYNSYEQYAASINCTLASNGFTAPSTPSGYTFSTWRTGQDGGDEYTSTMSFPNKTWTSSASTTLYAKWVTTVTLNKNGGSGSIVANDGTATGIENATHICTYGTTCSFPGASGLTQTGYTFAGGWGTSSSCTATTTSFTNPSGTYYACKTANTYTITLNDAANGGVGGTGTIKEVYNTKWTNSNDATITSVTIPTKDKNVFMGYYTAATGGTQKIPANGTLPATTTFTANTTLNAQFAACSCTKGTNVDTCTATGVTNNTCQFSYTCAAGWKNGSNTSGTFSAPAAATASATSPNCTTADTGVKYQVCHYTKNLGTSAYTLDGNSCENKSGTSNETLTVSDLKKTITGFTFVAGFAGTSAMGTTYPTSTAESTTTTVLPNGTRVISLYYTRDTHTVTLTKGNNISAVSGGGTYEYGASVTLGATVASGYHWTKWTQTSGGADVSTTQAYSFTMGTSDVAYTANAAANTWTVTYAGNGNSSASNTVPSNHSCSYAGTCTASAQGDLLKTNNVFGGWTVTCKKSDGTTACTPSVSTVAAGGSLNNVTTENGATITLTAIWTACGCTNASSATGCAVSGVTNNMCNYTWSCKDKYWGSQSATGQGTSFTAQCNSCPTSYNDGSDGTRTARTSCYKNVTRGCTENACSCPSNSSCTCSSCTCTGTTYKQYSNADGTGDGTMSGTTSNETCSQTVNTFACNAGYYNNSGTCTAVGDGYYSPANDNTHYNCKTEAGSSYTKSDGTRASKNDCYIPNCSKTCSGNATSSCPENSTCTYNTSYATTDGTQHFGGSCTSSASSCPVSGFSCNANWFKNSGGTACTACSTISFTDSGSDSCTGEIANAAAASKSFTRTCYRETSPEGSTSSSACIGSQNCGTKTYGTCTVSSCNDCSKGTGAKTCSVNISGNACVYSGTCNDGYNTPTASGTSIVCSANTFNVVYANGGGSGSAPSSPTSCTYNGTCNAPANTYSKTGHFFAGWACTASSGTCAKSTYSAGDSISTATTTNGATITLTATWSAQSDIVCAAGTYLPKGTVSCASCPAGKYCVGSGSTPFTYSATNDQGISGDCNANTYSTGGASAATCTACTTVTFACNGTDTTNTSTCPDGSTSKLHATGTSQAYTQTCHRTTSSAGSVSADACSGSATHSTKSYSGQTCYVTGCDTGHHQDPATNSTSCPANTFNVAYANGGGSGSAPSSPSSCTYNGTCNAPANTYSKTGHNFAGWACTASSGTCAKSTYSAGESLSTATTKNGETITLTATWSAQSDIVCAAGTYLPKRTVSCASCPAGKYCVGSGSTPFTYSATNDQGISGDCNANTYSTGGASAATCTACTTVTFACNGTDTTNTSTCPDGSTSKLHATGTSQAYTQTCHRTTSSAGSISADACSGSATHNTKSYSGQTCYITGCDTGYHKDPATNSTSCPANTFTVQYTPASGNEVGTTPSTQTCTYGGNNCSAPAGYTLDGKTFVGWGCTASSGSCASATYAKNASLNTATTVNGATLTMTAQWSTNALTLHWSPEYGTAPTDTTCSYGGTFTTPAAPSVSGRSFNGWLANNRTFAANQTYNCNYETLGVNVGEVTFNGDYDAISYTITYNLNGGTNNGLNLSSYTIDSSTVTLYNPTRANSTFLGWYESSSFSGSAVTSIATGSTGNKTFYAKWQCNEHYNDNDNDNVCSLNTYSVTYSCGDGSGTAPTTAPTATYSQTYTTAANTCTRTDWVFDGWLVSNANGDKKNENTGFTWNYTENKTLTAQWIQTAGNCQIGEYFDSSANTCRTCPTGYTSNRGAESINECYQTCQTDCINPGKNQDKPNNASNCTYDSGVQVDGIRYYPETTACTTTTKCNYKTITCLSNYYFTGSLNYYNNNGERNTGICMSCAEATTSYPNSIITKNTDIHSCFARSTYKCIADLEELTPYLATCELASASVSGVIYYDNPLTDDYVVKYPGQSCSVTNCTCPEGYTFNTSTSTCDVNTYAITLNDNGGANGDGTVYEQYTIGYSLTQNGTMDKTSVTVPTKTNSVFMGYYTAASGGTIVIDSAGNLPSAIKFTEDTELFAHWSACTACSNGTGAQNCALSVVNNVCTYSATCKTGYSTSGWPNNSGTSATCDGATCTCKINGYTITLDTATNGGSAGGTPTALYTIYNTGVYKDTSRSQSIASGDQISASDPTKTNAYFVGYYSAASGGTQYTSYDWPELLIAGLNAAKGYTSNQTWYAHYTCECRGALTAGCYHLNTTTNACDANVYNIHYAPGKSTATNVLFRGTGVTGIAPDSGTCTASNGGSCPTASNTFSKTGAVFDHWAFFVGSDDWADTYCLDNYDLNYCAVDYEAANGTTFTIVPYFVCDEGYGYNSSTGACEACANNYYKSEIENSSCVSCPTKYPYTDVTGTLAEGGCYLTTTPGKYVANYGQGETTCPANSYCPGGTKVYYSDLFGGAETGGSIACSTVEFDAGSTLTTTTSTCPDGSTTRAHATGTSQVSHQTCHRTTSPAGSDEASDCTGSGNCGTTTYETCYVTSCETGYHKNTSTNATSCVPNTYTIAYSAGDGGTGAAPTSPTTCTIGTPCLAPANTYTKSGAFFWHWELGAANLEPGEDINNILVQMSTQYPNGSTVTLTAGWVCNAGHGYNSSTKACGACNPGYYKEVSGNGACTPASDGYYTVGTANTEQSVCPVGSYSSASSASTSCTACPGGRTTSGTATHYNATANTACSATCSSIAHLATWATPSWSTSGVSNLCKVGTCEAGYTKNAASTACTAGSYDVTLNKNTSNSDTTVVDTVSATYDSAMPLKNKNNENLTIPTNGSYVITGYTDARNGGTKYYDISGTTITSAKNWDKAAATTLYAQWGACSCTNCTSTVASNACGGTCNTGYSTSGGTNTGTTATCNGTSCSCSPRTFTVSFNANNGSGGQSANVTATYAAAMPTISTTAPTRTGYTFMGWYDSATYTSGTQYYTAVGASARSWNKTANTTLYAGWKANTYTVSYKCGTGATGLAPSNATAIYDDGFIPVANNTCDKVGYTFNGWNDGSADRPVGTEFTWKYTSDKEFAPRWTPNVYEITLEDGRDAVDHGAPNPVYMKYDTGWYSDAAAQTAIEGLSALPTKVGYEFVAYKFIDEENDTAVEVTDIDGRFINNNFTAADATITVTWKPGKTDCSAGYYYYGSGSRCELCQENYYCPGGRFETDGGVAGLIVCPNGGASTAGATANTSCYADNLDTYVATYGSGTQTCYYNSSSNTYKDRCYNKTITKCLGGYYYDAASTTTASPDCVPVGPNFYSPADVIVRTACPPSHPLAEGDVTESIGLCYAECVNANNATAMNGRNYYDSTNGVCAVSLCQPGYYLKDGACTTCPAGYYCDGTLGGVGDGSTLCSATNAKYPNSAAGSDDANDCYLVTTSKNYVATAGAGEIACAAGNYCPGGTTVYVGGSVSGRATTGGITQCPANSYCVANVAAPTACGTTNANYPRSVAGSDEANDCYLVTTEHNYVATAGAGETSCAAGGYCPGGVTIYVGGTHGASHMTTGGRTECPANSYCVANVAAPTACSTTDANYPRSAAGSDDANDCYLITSQKKYVAMLGHGEETCIAGYYCPGGTTVYVGGNVSGRATVGGITICPENSYCVANVAAPTVCSVTNANYPLSAEGSDDANDCYLVTTATKYVALTGAGETSCAAGGYCPGGVTIYIGGNVDGRSTIGGRTICPKDKYCEAAVSAPTACSTLGSGDAFTTWAFTESDGSTSKNDCYSVCEDRAVTYGHAYPINEGETDTVIDRVTCISNGTGPTLSPSWPQTQVNYPAKCVFRGVSNTCNPCKVADLANGTCAEMACKSDYEMKNGVCQSCNRENAMVYESTGNCMVKECVNGFHPNGDACAEDVNECTASIPNATLANSTWNPSSKAFGICKVEECDDGYHIASNACVPNEQTCNVEHGVGTQTWNATTGKWNACEPTSCDAGYTSDDNEKNHPDEACSECKNKYLDNGDLAVSSYVRGCEIASCMYQGEKYALEGGECVPICQDTTDEFGNRKRWNASTKKCEFTCKPGYVPW